MSKQSARVKQEKTGPQQEEDKEYADWAKKLLTKPVPGQGTGNQTGSGSLAPLFAGQTNVSDALPPNSGFDTSSAIGKFFWTTFGDDKHVPCIYRNKDKYVCVRMAEESVLGEYLNVLPPELYDSAKITCYRLTPCEAKLLTYINSWHMDGFFGPEPFTTQHDYVISVTDLETFHNFLNFGFSVLHSGGSNFDPEFKKCGFVRVNGENLIPYSVLESGDKAVPLFYFEGQTDILAAKAQPLEGWPLAYLKVCCKVQGVRKDLILSPTLQIVTLTSLQSYFPKRTTFHDNCWPNPKPKSLLPKQILSIAIQTPKLQVTMDKWAKVEANESFPNFTTTTVTSTTNTTTTTQVSTTLLVNPKNNGVPTSVTLSCNGVPTNYNIPKSVQMRSPALTKIKISTPPSFNDKAKLIQIPESYQGKQPNAYAVRLLVVEGQFLHCINAQPGKQDEYLLVLQEFMQSFLPGVSIYPVGINLLQSKNIKTFLPNTDQISALNKFGYQIMEGWQMPLVPAAEMQAAIPKLKAAVQPRPIASAGSVTTNRVMNGGNNLSNASYSRHYQARR